MKHLIIGISITIVGLTACNSNNKSTETSGIDSTKKETKKTDSTMRPETTTATIKNTGSIKEIIKHYLHVKNALANDNAKDAAEGGKAFVAAMENTDISLLSAEEKKTYEDIEEDVSEHAEHISTNEKNIKHQREHFILLSKDMADLIKIFGNGGQTLYKDFCPMANDGKGAIWISEVKEIKNPYLGSEMPDCGTVKETIK